MPEKRNIKSGKQKYRAVVIGCGKIGSRFTRDAKAPGVHSHAQAYKENSRIELTGIVDNDPQRLAEAESLWNVSSDQDPVSLCRSQEPDIVSICTPDDSHYLVARTLLHESPPRLLFIEKPFTLKVKEAEEILQLAKQKSCAIAVNYSRRYSPAFQTLMNELQAGKHGRPLLARILYSKGLLHNGSHAIDLMRFWLGEPVKAVGNTSSIFGLPHDETFNAELWFPNNCLVRLEAFDERVATIFELDFLTEHSRWCFRLGGNNWEFFEIKDSSEFKGYKNYVLTERGNTDSVFLQPLRDCLRHAMANLVQYLDGTASLICTGDDGHAVLYWIEKIRGVR